PGNTLNTVTLSKAALGIAVAGTYNGTNSYTNGTGNETITLTGLVASDATKVTNNSNNNGVTATINSQDVSANATNFTSSIATSIFTVGNYALYNTASASATYNTTPGNTLNTVTLSKAALGIAVAGTYNGTNSYTNGTGNETITLTGLVGSDIGKNGVVATINSANVADNSTNYVSSYTASGFTIGNYLINTGVNTSGNAGSVVGSANSTGNNSVNLSKAALGLAITSTYNSSNTFTNTITSTGLVGGDVITSATTTALNVADNATNYVTGISGTAANGGAVNLSNYTISGGRVTTPGYTQNLVTLSGAPLAITVSGTYNGTTSFTNSNATINVAGLVGGETLVVTGVNVNSKDVAANGSNYVTGITSSTGSATLNNYAINSGYTAANSPLAARATASTTPNAVTISSLGLNSININADKTYDGTNSFYVTSGSLASNFTYTLTGMVNGDAAPTITGGNATVSSANAATYNSFVTNTFTLSNTNYTFGGGAVNATINKAPITISTSNVVKTYDASLSALGTAIVTSGTLYTNASNSSTTDSLSGGAFAYTNANVGSGNKTVTVAGVTVNDGNNGNNYTVTYANNTTSTINKANLSITGAVASKAYTGSVQTNTYSTSGLLGSDNVTGVAGLASRTQPGTTGDNLSSATGTGISNYQINFVNGSLTILAASEPPLPLPILLPPPPSPPAPPPAVTTIQVSGGALGLAPVVSSPSVNVSASPVPVSGSAPAYPAAAQASGTSGKVILDIVVDASGKVTKVTVVSSSGSGDLDAAAVTAAQSWVYEPAAGSAPRIATSEINFAVARN
ncbi:TonB family protein, partial [Polynucleobacter sp. AP-Nickl1-40-C4]|uniref:beta strand repeat-containing protein n=1 Tax=Polynucleobacter sp. AP-Nickl1-40-C4 TaxID=3108275 RepID=UPI002B232683